MTAGYTAYILNNWSIKEKRSPRGTIHVRLYGKVFGHPRFAPGEIITTSTLKKYRFDSDSVITHSGSEYRLAHADHGEPLAKQRLIALLVQGQTVLDPDGELSHAPALDHEPTRVHA